MKRLVLALCSVIYSCMYAQKDSAISAFRWQAYSEFYFGKNLSNSSGEKQEDFIYNYKNLNQISLNLLMLSGEYTTERERAKLGLMLGDYAENNLSTEPDWARYIYEAQVGYKILRDHDIWVDVGIFPSHIGAETAIGADNINLTRSLVADNSPYYEAGAKLSYTSPSKKWFLSFLLLNGWQRIRKVADVAWTSIGTQVSYTPNEYWSYNYSSFIGSDLPKSVGHTRWYHNFYASAQLTPKWKLLVGMDVGTDFFPTEQKTWFSPVLQSQYAFQPTLLLGGRWEWFSDRQMTALSYENQTSGKNIQGLSMNLDWKFSKNFMWRNEAKVFISSEPIFQNKKEQYLWTGSFIFRLTQ